MVRLFQSTKKKNNSNSIYTEPLLIRTHRHKSYVFDRKMEKNQTKKPKPIVYVNRNLIATFAISTNCIHYDLALNKCILCTNAHFESI